jgi:hypothetical protein
MDNRSGWGAFMRSNTTPRLLFVCGALVFPSFLLQQDIVIRAFQVLLFICLCALSGRRVRPLQYLVVAAGIVIFNLVIPTGRVLLAVAGLPVTEGALKSGLLKATAMTGLIALSQFSIRSDLHIPGRIGGLLGRSLFYFERIMSDRRKVDRRDIIGSIDALLLEVHRAPAPDETRASSPSRSTARGFVALSILVALNWGALVVSLVHPRLFWRS